MTLLGKIFTVCILIASLFLMFVAMVVYATHTNWQQAYQAKNQQLLTAQTEKSTLVTQYGNQISQLKAENEAAQQDVRKLESERVALANQNATIQKEVDQLRAQRREAEAMVAATQENNKQLTAEVLKLRDSIKENQTARDQAFATTLKATSQLHVTAGDLQTTKERNDQLVQQVASLKRVVDSNGINPNDPVVDQVQGKISATRRADGQQLIEITVGADDGIRQGGTVEIYRGQRYLGRAQIMRADPDRAVAQVMREYQVGQVQEGDNVATKFRVR
jgi:hypothetical protein